MSTINCNVKWILFITFLWNFSSFLKWNLRCNFRCNIVCLLNFKHLSNCFVNFFVLAMHHHVHLEMQLNCNLKYIRNFNLKCKCIFRYTIRSTLNCTDMFIILKSSNTSSASFLLLYSTSSIAFKENSKVPIQNLTLSPPSSVPSSAASGPLFHKTFCTHLCITHYINNCIHTWNSSAT